MGHKKSTKHASASASLSLPLAVVFLSMGSTQQVFSQETGGAAAAEPARVAAQESSAPSPQCFGGAVRTTAEGPMGRSYCSRPVSDLAELLMRDASFRSQNDHPEFKNPYYGLASADGPSVSRVLPAKALNTFWETPSSQIVYQTLNSPSSQTVQNYGLKRVNCTQVAASLPLYLMTHRVTARSTNNCGNDENCAPNFTLFLQPRSSMRELSSGLGMSAEERGMRQELLTAQTTPWGSENDQTSRNDMKMFWSTIGQSLGSVSAWVYHPGSEREQVRPTRPSGTSLSIRARDVVEIPEDPHFAAESSVGDVQKVHRQFGEIHFSIPENPPGHVNHPLPLSFDVAQCAPNQTPNLRTCEFDFQVRQCGLMGDALRLSRNFENFYLSRRAYMPAVWERPAGQQASSTAAPVEGGPDQLSATIIDPFTQAPAAVAN